MTKRWLIDRGFLFLLIGGLTLLSGLATFLLLPRITVRASRAIYYVAANGNDSNPGTIDQPFASLGHASNVVQAGDDVKVRGGIYTLTDGILIGSTGTANAFITYEAYTGEKVVFDGSGSTNKTCLVVMGQYNILKNFECQNWFQGIMAWNSQHNQILNNRVHDTTAYGMLMASDKWGGTSDILVQGNTVYHSGGVQNGTGGIDVTYATNISLIGNTVYENRGLGFDINGSDTIEMAANVLHDNRGNEININNLTNSTCEKNFIYESLPASAHADGKLPSGIQMGNYDDISPNPINHNTIRNNIVIGAETSFFYANIGRAGGIKNTLIANNTFYGAHGLVIYVEGTSDHVNTQFINNIFYATHAGGIGAIGQSSGLVFHHNLWWGGDGNAGGGAGENDVHADPQLINPGSLEAAGYKLQASSPAHNGGIGLSTVKDDFTGGQRPTLGASDIGALQFGSTVEDKPTAATSSTPTTTVTAVTPTPTATTHVQVAIHIPTTDQRSRNEANHSSRQAVQQKSTPIQPMLWVSLILGSVALLAGGTFFIVLAYRKRHHKDKV